MGVSCAVVGGYALAAALVLPSSLLGWQGPYATRPLVQVVTVLCLLFAAGCAARAARHAVGRRRFGWLSLAVALTGWVVGEIIWAVLDVRTELDHASHPAAAEFVLLLFPIGVLTALASLANPQGHNIWRLVLDGIIVATSLFVASWVFVLDKLLQTANSSRPTTVVHVVTDVMLMTVAILVLSRGRPGGRRSITLLAGGITTIMLADLLVLFRTGVGSYHTGDLVDVTRVAGLGLVALAGLVSTTESPTATNLDEVTSRVRLWLPYLPLLLAAAVGLGHALHRMQHGPLLFGLGILVGAVLIRQLVVLVENQGLLTEVAQEAFRDSLTGLANRANFLHRLEEAVERRRQDGTPIAVMCLDLDDFKSVNDALGHPAGDELLVRVAGRLTAALGQQGTVARLGGDEFAVLLEGPVADSHAAAQRVLEAFDATIVIDGVPLAVRPSIGFTVAVAESNATVDELLRHADLAMYAAKREGGQCIRSFVPDLPLPYALPELSGSAITAIQDSIDGGLEHTRRTAPQGSTALARTIKPLAAAAKPTPDPHEALPSVRWPPTSIRIALAALAIGVLVFASSCLPDPHADHTPFFANVFYPGLNLFAALLVGIRAYRVRADRAAWILIAAGMASSGLGDVIYARWVTGGQSPSIADPAYLAFYPLTYAGLLLLMQARLKRVPLAVRLDSVVCGLAMAAVAAALTAGPIQAATARAPATVLVGLIYPWCDLVLLALAAGMLPILGWRHEFRWSLLVAGFVLFAAADTAYLFETSASEYRVGTLLDACWPASSLFLALAAWTAWSSTPPLPRRGLGYYAAPVACTVVALAVTAVGHESRSAPILAALSLIAVAARFSVTFREVSNLAENHKQAMTDGVTGLPNRRSLATTLTEVPVSPPRTPVVGPPLLARAPARRALLLLQLLEFHEINDTVGPRFGDELLRQIADRLSQNVRRDDLLARVGDDQFAILLAEGADLIAARAQAGRLLEALGEPFALDPVTIQVDARIAIALFPDHCDHPQELLNRAEITLPHAKSAHGRIAVYDTAFELYRENDPSLIEELRAALADGSELTCHYQPKINAADGSVHSVEALLRWHHPARGLLLPEEFLPEAERAGLMRKIANRTVDLALKQARAWRDQGLPLTIAVNLSTTNLLDLDLVGSIDQQLRTHGLPADALIIEITESTLVDSARSRNTVAALQQLGVRISLDDYGTWSSLARLQDVSVDELKLDRVFVARLAQDPRSVAIVRSTVALAESLGADLVAEGVEDEVTLRALRQYGCTITQGFVHSPPLPGSDLRDWILTNAPGPAPKKAQQQPS
ncbi:diguanylate cyclase domain-containing protein [Mycobacterium kiyosense]|uniref:diguanylate cyclase domain-containing protein n=1 Tax=Mycobacterium kiyosense TaxID=2871094 RepID=UPI00223059C9|nr:diguanylate cyclase [Mycobacterium kiyosense]